MKKVEASCNSKCIHDKDDFITCLKIKATEFAKVVHPSYEELDWEWVIFKKNKAGSNWYDDRCKKEVPSIEEIEECCHDLLDDMKKNNWISLGTGGIVIETNDFGGVIKFNPKARITRKRRQ